MKVKYKILYIFFITGFILAFNQEIIANDKNIPPQDLEYLEGVYKATFEGIKFFVHPKSSLPYDVNNFKKETSTTNIGLYIASVAVASKTKLIPNTEAIKMIELALNSLEKIERWRGFPVDWVNIASLKPAYGPTYSYADQTGNLLLGLITVAGIFPEEFGPKIDSYIESMDFRATYDPSTAWLKGGYNIIKKDFVIKQHWGRRYHNLLAGDTRSFSLIGIALGQIPGKHWEMLNRDRTPWGKLDWEMALSLFPDKVNNMPYYSPGMEGGGLFMQYLPGIFLNEKALPLEISARNFSQSQIEYSRKKDYYPFWGISSCETPDGKSYIGWGNLKENVVTPHAVVLAIENHPNEVLEALRMLERKGARALYKNKYDFGFTDSYDFKSEKASKNYLVLDQCMLFLSLANYLCDDTVRKSFDSHPIGHKVNETENRLEKGKDSLAEIGAIPKRGALHVNIGEGKIGTAVPILLRMRERGRS